ncbi:MAG TPA: ABC transporter permease [Acidimicrobiales bacterium]|nr:ABC transporter permease [Acidimicrobiales bacterium]
MTSPRLSSTGRARTNRHRRDLLAALVTRDVALRYRRSILGLLWSQLGPLVMLAVLTFVFTRVVPLDIADYAPFVFIGLLAWTWWSGAILTATASVSGAADLVRRPGFPVAVLPAVAVTSHLIHLVLALPVLVLAVVLATGGLPATFVALPLLLSLQALLLLGPAWVLAALNVRYRDVQHLVGVLLFPFFYVTPVFYDAGAVPSSVRGAYRLNPLVHLFEAYRDVALYGRWPALGPLLAIAVVGGLAAVAGHRCFTALAPRFPDEL